MESIVIARGTHKSGAPLRVYRLLLQGVEAAVWVREIGPPKHLPKNCVQRHMNTDGSFCIGLGAPWIVKDEDGAHRWWHWLLGYLRCQDIASVARRWPPNRGLSHGDAAELQLQAEELAAAVGVLSQYREHLEYGAPWPPADAPAGAQMDELLRVEDRRRVADEEFVRLYVRYSCCGTMDDCPIANRERHAQGAGA